MNPDDIARIRALADAATPGPWEAYDLNEGMEPVYGPMWCVANDEFHNPGPDESAPWIDVGIHGGDKADAEFIAEARTALPAALDALEQAEAERDYRKRENEELSLALSLALTGEEVQTGERYSNAVALAQAVRRADRAEARAKAMRELHGEAPGFYADGGSACGECIEPWPCPTIRALDA